MVKKKEDWSEWVCAEKGCYNAPIQGYIYCEECLYGHPRLAIGEARRWKAKKEGYYFDKDGLQKRHVKERTKHLEVMGEFINPLCGSKGKSVTMTSIRNFVSCKNCLRILNKEGK